MTMEEQLGVTECVAYLTAAARMTVAKKSVVHSAATSWSGRAGERASERGLCVLQANSIWGATAMPTGRKNVAREGRTCD